MESSNRVFIADCRWLAETLGVQKTAYVVSSSIEGVHLRYEDHTVIVEAGLKDKSLTITGKGERQGGVLPVENPVLYADAGGKVYRFHGEAHRLFNHVRNLVSSGAGQ